MKTTDYKALWVQIIVHPPSHVESSVLPFALKMGVLLLSKGEWGLRCMWLGRHLVQREL